MPSPGQVGDYTVTYAVSDGEAKVTQTSQIVVALSPQVPNVTLDLTPYDPPYQERKW